MELAWVTQIIQRVDIGTILTVCAVMIWIYRKLKQDIDGFERRMDGHAARIDQLYSMFVQLLKEGRK